MIDLFTGDLHLGSSIRTRHPQLSEDWRRALTAMERRILRMHAEKTVRSVTFPGDIFHRDAINGDEIKAFGDTCGRLLKVGISLYAIQGNHDWNPGHPLFEPLGVVPLGLEPRAMSDEKGALRVCGVDFDPDNQAMRSRISSVPPCDILVVHSGFDWNLGYESANSLKDEDIPAHVGAVIAGHVHVPGVKGRIFSAGSLVPTSFAETSRRILWSVEGDEITEIELPSRALAAIEVRCDADMGDLEYELARLEQAVSGGEPRGQLGAAILVKMTQDMASQVSDAEKAHPSIVFCRGVLSADADILVAAESAAGATLADAVPMIIPANRQRVRQAALDICNGSVTAIQAAETLKKAVESSLSAK